VLASCYDGADCQQHRTERKRYRNVIRARHAIKTADECMGWSVLVAGLDEIKNE